MFGSWELWGKGNGTSIKFSDEFELFKVSLFIFWWKRGLVQVPEMPATGKEWVCPCKEQAWDSVPGKENILSYIPFVWRQAFQIPSLKPYISTCFPLAGATNFGSWWINSYVVKGNRLSSMVSKRTNGILHL